MIPTRMPIFFERVTLYELKAPTFPLPVLRISMAALRRTTKYAVGMEPKRYPPKMLIRYVKDKDTALVADKFVS
jgi:hypothetical protein